MNAWVSISRGCDKFCTFCIVPFTRGRERSRSFESIIDEVKDAVSNGFTEITLLGQNVNSFRTENGKFPHLLKQVAGVSGVKRIRYMSPHPQDMDEHLLQVMCDHENICNYIHLPLQAGSDRILKRMNRTYSQNEFLELVDTIRRYMPDCSISTDIIVGFPNETEEEFQDTLKLLDEAQFDFIYSYVYSPRKGTKSAKMADDLSDDVRGERLRYLQKYQLNVQGKLRAPLKGQIMRVLVDGQGHQKGIKKWKGRTNCNRIVHFEPEGPEKNYLWQLFFPRLEPSME